MNTEIKNIPPTYIDQMVLKAKFTVPYQYKIQFTKGLFDPQNGLIREYYETEKYSSGQSPKVLFMVDQGVADSHPDLFSKINTCFKNVPVDYIHKKYVFPGGEQVKNNRKIQSDMLGIIDQNSIDRHSYVIGIGGGAVLDAVGYAAAISHRGVRHIRIPTTVLSQNDSGIGVKNGINLFGKKNYLGSFSPPDAVWNDFDFLHTLSDRDKRAGLAEAVKVALIKDVHFFEWLEQHSQELRNFSDEVLHQSIIDCARLHMQHITTNGDPFERGSARPLDFGHWAAHRLEDLSDYEIRHGEAVSVGIMLDSIYSHLMGYMDSKSQDRILNLFARLGFSPAYEYLDGLKFDQLLEGLNEFREHLGGRLTITLLGRIGHGFEVHEIDTDIMKKAFRQLVRLKTTNEN